MNKEVYLKLDGVHGESRIPRHLGSIEVTAFTWGTDQPGASGGGVGRGRANISDLIVTKARDMTTPILRLASASGQHFKSAVLTVEEIGNTGRVVKTLVWRMSDILIDSVTSSGNSRAGEPVMESIKLNFANYRIEQR